MGVPKFFRYTSERYPCLNELVKQYQIPDFDNMYLDMNGIIHNCSHPDDSNPHFRITEEKIFQDVFHYISILFQIIKPKKLFFMAIDGVAPRAKMNQQRGRRFRSAREAEKLEDEAKAKGEVLPTEERFDSNCITPGTVFMARLHEQLRYFVKQKMSSDPMWAKVKVILSGHETPGEGEHKIMDYIRWARSQPDYDPNTRHCLYGLDADLIMLGMCTHEPHFALLREEVKFGKTTQRSTSPEETNFYLLHLSLLREYLEQEFIQIKDKLPFEYDIEKIVDDWVLMGFLVGNDFIPNLPNMHITNEKNQDALPLLYKTYMNVLPALDGYINEAGDLNLQRFEVFMQELAKIDKERFQDDYADLKYFEEKTGRRPNANERREYKPNNDDTFNVNLDDIKANKPDDELQALINATQEMYMNDFGNDCSDDDDDEMSDTSDEEATFNLEFKLHKKDYYMNKLDYSKVTDEVLASQAEGYVRAIQWNLWYYYKGCQSWGWYYPHHYAPYMSDIKGFKDYKIEFEMGKPFKPFEQLLAVLPAASKHLLPTPYHSLMTEENSPIFSYYPINFETDLNGKKNDWEAVVLIPFINEESLLSAMEPCYQLLTEDEKKRNTHGPMLVYNWVKDSLGPANAPQYFPTIAENHALEMPIWREELDVPLTQLKRGMLPNAIRDMLFPGFPTMRHLKYETALKVCKVKVFDTPSRKENMIVAIIREVPVDPPLETVAVNMLGKVVWVGWPHLAKAKVVSVSNERERLHLSHGDLTLFTREMNMGNMHKQWISERSTIFEHNMNRMGIELGDVNTIIHAVNLKGYKYIVQDNTEMACEPVWCTNSCGYAYQAVLQDVRTFIMDTPRKYCSAQEAYPPGDNVFLITQGQYYGSMAKVLDSESIRSGRIKVQVTDRPQPIPVVTASACPYKTVNHAAASIGISTQLLSRITGSILVIPGPRIDGPTEGKPKINIGVNLKFNKKNLEVAGYTRRCPATGQWQYSKRCIELVKEFVQHFPDLFNTLSSLMGNDIFYESDLWPREMGKNKPQEVAAWLKTQAHTNALRRECGSEALEAEELASLAREMDAQRDELRACQKTVQLHVKWHLVYKPELHEGNIPPDPKADFQMYDRVVSVAKNITVPVGYEGTITAIYQPRASNTVRLSDKMNAEPLYQVLFDDPFPGALYQEGFDKQRLYRMPPTFLLNISFGRKLRDAVKTVPVEQNNYALSKPPNILRRGDGHHSAFASYSPTKDRQTPIIENRINSSTRAPHVPNPAKAGPVPVVANSPTAAPVPDGSELLKSLLKISDNSDTRSKSQSKNQPQPPPEPLQNWRAKKEPLLTQPSPRPGQTQPTNWRHESAQQIEANNAELTAVTREWTNSYKAQPPHQPLPPNFNQSFHLPKPGQIPMPQFQNPNFHQRNHYNNQNHSQPFVNQYNNYTNQPINSNFNHQNHTNPQYGQQNAQGSMMGAQFPSHLPNAPVPTGSLQTNSAARQHSNRTNYSGANVEKPINPFVPLQVQTSQRKVQNPSAPASSKPNPQLEENAHTAPVIHSSQLSQMQIPPTQQQRPKRPRRPKIAASLPFDTS